MMKNPIINALSAFAYIVGISLLMNTAGKTIPKDNQFLSPIVFLSLFVFSASFMAYVFCLTPVKMYLDGKKSQAVNLFVQTLATFGVCTAVMIFVLFSGLIH
ncbi:MAG TPA: hypothetical protein VLH19_04150 [Patescibacteria group bacterium]|nr:hypothetical protein [Patescibacteria group bacterium]